jgi:DNA-damage-inducible protein J
MVCQGCVGSAYIYNHLLAFVFKTGYNHLRKGDEIMANSLVQFRTDDDLKLEATAICEKLGIDLPTYLRICIARLIQENGIPFSMTLNQVPESKGLQAMKAASRIAQENGISGMTLEEINAEIAEARK